MIYPPSTNITYTAVGSTVGLPGDTFTYSWAFDDNTTRSGGILSKSWATSGDHLATVTATDNYTLSSATATKSIYVFDVTTTITWTSTAKQFTTNTVIPRTGANYFFGNSIIMFGTSTSTIGNVGVYNIDTNTLTNYASVLPSTGGCAGACQIPSGTLAGNILLWGAFNGDYGYWDTSLNAYMSLGNLGTNGSVAGGDWPSSASGTKIISTSYNSISGNYTIIEFNTTTNAFTLPGIEFAHGTKPNQFFTLPSGNVLILYINSTATSIYNITTKAIVSGPSLSHPTIGGFQLGLKMSDGTVSIITTGASANISVFTEDLLSPTLGAWVDRASYPYTSQVATATGNGGTVYALTPGGDLLEVGGLLQGPTTVKPKSAIFLQTNSTFYFMNSAFSLYSGGFCQYYGGRFWAVDGTTSTIYYSSLWSR